MPKEPRRGGLIVSRWEIFTDAMIVDGTGKPAFRGEIGVQDDRIAYVGPVRETHPLQADVTSLHGAVVSPGFIDVHSHADNAAFLDEADTSKIVQGVTTEILGNCGMTLAPRSSAHGSTLEAYAGRLFPSVSWTGHRFADYWSEAERRGLVTNAAPLVGHGTIRIAVKGMEASFASKGELQEMKGHLEEALDAGAFGFSSGLIYPPGMFSDTDELIAMAQSLDGAHYVTHMRSEGQALEKSVAEAIAIGREAKVPVQISHHKAAGRAHWGKTVKTLPMIDAARSEGLEVRCDVYPYTASSTMLTTCLPDWTQVGGDAATLAMLRDPTVRAKIRADLESESGGWAENVVWQRGEGIRIGSTPDRRFEGKTLSEIAEAGGIGPVDALFMVLEEERLKVSVILYSMEEGDVERVLAYPWTMVGSDGLPPGVGGLPHPRLYGTFPRVIARYVRERGLLSLEQAVRKMTGLAADTFGLRDRGIVHEGAIADLVAFNAETIRDVATFDDPVRTPLGIHWVMQSGQIVVRGGQYVGRRQGQRLRRQDIEVTRE